MECARTAYRPMPRQLAVAVEGFPFIAAALFSALAAWMMGLASLALAALCFAAFTAFFFRNPHRIAPDGADLVVAPADGRVIRVGRVDRAPHTGEAAIKVSIFMSVFNVHINRSPVAGRVRQAVYRAGRFFVASLDKACEHNEQNALVIEDASGRRIVMVQIAGIIARRIVCYLRENDSLSAGERLGLIRFGSRVDLYLPPDAEVDVAVGARTRAGETILGRLQ